MDTEFRSQVPAVTPAMLSDLRIVMRRMADLGFTEASVEGALGLRPLAYRRLSSILPYRARLMAHGALGIAIRFWLLQEFLSLEEARQGLGDHAISVLNQMGWLHVTSAGLRSRVDLYPCCGRYFFTDSANNAFPWPEQVYWLGYDSYTLAYCTPRQPRARALDICTGSGVHAVLAAAHCEHSIGLDINPRALEFSRLNTRLNGLEAEFHPSDCYQAVTGQQFDLITLNPPFVPTPNQVPELYRTGGDSGESVTRRIIEGLPLFLRTGGLFSMSTEAPRRPGESPVDRMKEWLGPGWGIVGLYKQDFSIEEYILGHILGSDVVEADRADEFERWLDTYRQEKITSMTSAQFYALRLPEGSPGWSWERDYPPPYTDQSAFLGDWLAALQAWHEPWPGDFQPRLHPAVRQIYWADDCALVEWNGTHWFPSPTRLEAAHTRALRKALQSADLTGNETYVRQLGCSCILTPP
ncbi:hypothetical protein ABS71_08830 [bacterium SCN 62-11]|nr:methyltransferase [Candidatus Eremiobacteraeota bacterium]ODT69856.1 MAG: hypothetical protein ABS71_08830 [bacterium SCN 62-11]